MILRYSSVGCFRQTPCRFDFLVGSVFNILYILFNLPIQILVVGYGNDVTNLFSFLCKARTDFLFGFVRFFINNIINK